MARDDWRYELTREALIEEIGGRTRVYGRWDWKFGCWDLDVAFWQITEVVPDWPMLDRRGVWLEPQAIRGPAGHPKDARWRFEARAAFAAYFSLIPAWIRLAAAPSECGQWVALANLAGDARCPGRPPLDPSRYSSPLASR